MKSWNDEDWQAEIKRSLKQEVLPQFKKRIGTDQFISPFSVGQGSRDLQASVAGTKNFLAIQNYTELKKSGLQEWLADEDVGFRFRQLQDLMECQESFGRSVRVFLSQPFPFELTSEQEAFVEKHGNDGHFLNLGWSPLSFGLARGEILKRPFLGWEKIFHSKALQNENIQWFYLSSAPYQWAGAEPQMELAILLSLAYSVLRELKAVQVPLATAVKKISFGVAVGTDVLVESSKITALKTLWARLNELLEVNSVPEVYVLPSLRSFSGRDPWNNVMRQTLMAFSALVGGAQGFKCIPYDALNKKKNPDAVRVSTNIPLLLKKESYLSLVSNPLDGAPLFENAVDLLCHQAWTIFQEIENKGGIFETARSGWLQTELKRMAEFSTDQVDYMQKEIIGVNKYVAAVAEPSEIIKLSDIIDPLFLTKSADDYLSVEPLGISALGYDWEVLQVNSDKFMARHGRRPQVLVIKGGGPVVEKKAAWLKNILHLGGIEAQVQSAEDQRIPENISPLAILVSSIEERDEELSALLRTNSFERIWSMGRPREGGTISRYIGPDSQGMELVKDIQKIVMGGAL